MPGNKKPRRPRRIERNPLQRLAITAGAHSKVDLNQQQLLHLGLVVSTALEAIRMGRGTQQDLGTMGMCCNLSHVLCEADIAGSRQHTNITDEGGKALEAAHIRNVGRDLVVFTGPELCAVAALVGLHRQQLESGYVTEGILVAALTEVEKRMK